MAIWELDGLDCQKCAESVKSLRGCEKDTEPYDVRGDMYTRCAKKMVTDKTYAWLEYYRYYDNGFLPAPGTILDQAHKFLKVVEIIDAEIVKRNRMRVKNG